MPRKMKTIYEFLNAKEEDIERVISQLSEKEKELLKKAYGEDLKKPVRSSEWTSNDNSSFYTILIPKMKEILNGTYVSRGKRGSQKQNISVETFSTEIPDSTETITSTSEETTISEETPSVVESQSVFKQDYIEMLELFDKPIFRQMRSNLSNLEAVIFSLRFGYVNGKYFTTEAISNFLEIEQEEVVNILLQVLNKYRDGFNKIMDETILYIASEAIYKQKNK